MYKPITLLVSALGFALISISADSRAVGDFSRNYYNNKNDRVDVSPENKSTQKISKKTTRKPISKIIPEKNNFTQDKKSNDYFLVAIGSSTAGFDKEDYQDITITNDSPKTRGDSLSVGWIAQMFGGYKQIKFVYVNLKNTLRADSSCNNGNITCSAVANNIVYRLSFLTPIYSKPIPYSGLNFMFGLGYNHFIKDAKSVATNRQDLIDSSTTSDSLTLDLSLDLVFSQKIMLNYTMYHTLTGDEEKNATSVSLAILF